MTTEDGPAPEISVVIPCFNEEQNVRQIHAAVRAELEAHAASFEILFIDNKSTDRTRDLLREICAGCPNTRAIFNNRNYGQMRSPTYAIYQAAGDAVIGMCADFQDPPALIGPMIAAWRAGARVVLGQRQGERTTAGLRITRRLGYAVLGRIGDYPVIPNATGFGLFDRACVDALAKWHEPEPFFRGMIVESGFSIALIPFQRPERAAGETKNNFATLFSFAISGLAGSAKSLLRLPLPLSVFAALTTALLAGGWLFSLFLSGAAAWRLPLALAALQMFSLSVLLLFLGLIGEQVRVISERTRHVPLVIEEERLNFPPTRAIPAARTLVRPNA